MYNPQPCMEISVCFFQVSPVGRVGKMSEAAVAVLFLCSDEASYLTGVVLPVDGGLTA